MFSPCCGCSQGSLSPTSTLFHLYFDGGAPNWDASSLSWATRRKGLRLTLVSAGDALSVCPRASNARDTCLSWDVSMHSRVSAMHAATPHSYPFAPTHLPQTVRKMRRRFDGALLRVQRVVQPPRARAERHALCLENELAAV